MKEIVFSDSAKGSLKLAQRYNAEQMMSDGPMAFIGEPPTKDELRRLWDGQPVGGNPQDVLGLSFSLDVGDIAGPADGEKRMETIRLLWGEGAPEDALAGYMQSCADDLRAAKEAAAKGEKLRVWVSDAPSSACGLRHLLWEIRRCDCPVSVVELPRYVEQPDGSLQRFSGWAEMYPGQFARFLPLERTLGRMEKRVLAQEWADAMEKNAPLRAMVNGCLLSVDEDFYDPMLLSCMTGGEMHMGRLLGEVLSRYPIGVGDGWYAQRIRKMIDSGALKVTGSGDGRHPYSVRFVRT